MRPKCPGWTLTASPAESQKQTLNLPSKIPPRHDSTLTSHSGRRQMNRVRNYFRNRRETAEYTYSNCQKYPSNLSLHLDGLKKALNVKPNQVECANALLIFQLRRTVFKTESFSTLTCDRRPIAEHFCSCRTKVTVVEIVPLCI